MASKIEKQIWETFVRRPGDLKEADAIPLVLRNLTPGREKYRMRHVVATVRRDAEATMDLLRVRTVVGVQLPESWGIKILRDLPIELPGKPYRDFYEALNAAAAKSKS